VCVCVRACVYVGVWVSVGVGVCQDDQRNRIWRGYYDQERERIMMLSNTGGASTRTFPLGADLDDAAPRAVPFPGSKNRRRRDDVVGVLGERDTILVAKSRCMQVANPSIFTISVRPQS
jgi:hypothetical protein